jgi:L-lactate dehydrogenase complex protein LldG
MSENARGRIFDRLNSAARPDCPRPTDAPPPARPPTAGEMTARLKQLMEAMRTEVHVVPAAEWAATLKRLLRQRGLATLVYAPNTPLGQALAAAWREDAAGLPELIAYAEPVEAFKERLFAADAGITAALGAVAETGAILLVPGAAEPRLLSLVPPLHIAVLSAKDIVFSLSDALAAGRFAADMPTNLLLISGPSKTADIELTLAFGVHGPKELVVLILE